MGQQIVTMNENPESQCLNRLSNLVSVTILIMSVVGIGSEKCVLKRGECRN